MKYLLALFVMSLTLQPVELQSCPMEGDQQPAHHAAMSGHGAAMNDHGDSGCCNADSADQPKIDCTDAAHCAALSPGFLVIPPTSGALQAPSGDKYFVSDGASYSGPPAPRHFRPPIA